MLHCCLPLNPFGESFHLLLPGIFIYAFVIQTLHIVVCSLSNGATHVCVCLLCEKNGWILRLGEIRCLHLDRRFLLADYCIVISTTNGNTDRRTFTKNTHTHAHWRHTADPTHPRKGPSCINTKIVLCFPFFPSTLFLTNLAAFLFRLSVSSAISRGFL